MFKGLFDLLVGFAAVLDVPPSWWILYEPKKPQALKTNKKMIKLSSFYFLFYNISMEKILYNRTICENGRCHIKNNSIL